LWTAFHAKGREVDFESIVARQPRDLAAAPTTSDSIAIWKFTTGSTGKPKACVHMVRSPLVSYNAYARGVLDIREDDVVLPVPKLFFGYVRDLAALFPFGVGATGLLFSERTTAELIFDLIARHRPTILVNVPTMMQAMLDHPSAAGQDLSCLRICTSAGEALPEPLHRRWDDAFGVEVLDGIGSSEAYHIYISNRPGRSRPGSIGEVVPSYSAEVVDDEGEAVPDGQIGRLWVRGESTALMYWGDEDASASTFAGDRVMTGDLVERDAAVLLELEVGEVVQATAVTEERVRMPGELRCHAGTSCTLQTFGSQYSARSCSRSTSSGARPCGNQYSPLSGNAISTHSSHSDTVPVMRAERGAARRIRPPTLSWIRIQASKARPSSSRHSA